MRRAAIVLLCILATAPFVSPAGAVDSPTAPLFLDDIGPVLLGEREICSLMNEDAAAASITGQDGASSIVVGGKSYWTFGDTFMGQNAQGVYFRPNNVAVSTDTNASDCVQMTHKATAGVARELLQPLAEESTVWPDGMVATGPGTIHVYVVSVVPNPNVWIDVRGTGLAKFDTNTLEATRVVDLLWDANSGFGGTIGVRSPIVKDGYVHLFIHTGTGRVMLGRVPLAEIESIDAYRYWDGAGWSAAPSDAQPLWTQPTFFNGAVVRWNEVLHKWLAMYNDSAAAVRVRTADALTGPWSEEYEWIDCSRYVPGSGLLCYTAEFHPQYDRDGGRVMVVSYSSLDPYEVVLHEVRLGVPVYQWRSGGEVRFAPTSPGPSFASDGIAFYASDVPVPGFAAIRRFVRTNGDVLYRPYLPGLDYADHGIAFYAPVKKDPPGATMAFQPVYQWDNGASRVLSPLPAWGDAGYTRGPIAFYAVCGDQDFDGVDGCGEAWNGTNPEMQDSDADGWGDVPASVNNPNATVAWDNCPAVWNDSQENSDGEPLVQNLSVADSTNPAADNEGDACDDDLDNDDLTNDEEASLGTNPLSEDTDGDRQTDHVETIAGSDPLDVASMPAGVDTDGDQLTDAVEAILGTNAAVRDSDGDGFIDSIEVRWTTNPLASDSDGDGCSDRREIASVNMDHTVSAGDLQMIAVNFGRKGADYRQVDVNRDGMIGSGDLFLAANAFGRC